MDADSCCGEWHAKGLAGVAQVLKLHGRQLRHLLRRVTRELVTAQQPFGRQQSDAVPDCGFSELLDGSAAFEQFAQEPFACRSRRAMNALQQPLELELDCFRMRPSHRSGRPGRLAVGSLSGGGSHGDLDWSGWGGSPVNRNSRSQA